MFTRKKEKIDSELILRLYTALRESNKENTKQHKEFKAQLTKMVKYIKYLEEKLCELAIERDGLIMEKEGL